MKISISEEICILYHDINGNIIMNMDDKYFSLDINSNDELELDEIVDINLLNKNKSINTYGKIHNTYENETLRSKIIDELEKDDSDNDSEIYDDLIDGYNNRKKCFPEEKYFNVENDNISIKSNDSEDNTQFYRYGNSDILKCFDKYFNSSSLYDTFIFDDENKFMLVSLKNNQYNSYRITITLSGKFILNIIGTTTKYFDLKLNDENIPQLIINKSMVNGIDKTEIFE